MVSKAEINDLKVANISKGKLPRQYINITNKDSFYISKDNEIFKVDLNIEESEIKNIILYNGADNDVKHLKQSDVTFIVTNIGVVAMSINKNILYFSKPNGISIYA